jgi:uncharacterized membrane protein YkvA (DUF1232 family)
VIQGENMLAKIRGIAKKLKDEIGTLYLCYKDPKIPWYAKGMAIFTISYALSPIDLIPDFIPILGFLDDVILLPLFIWFSLKLIPDKIIKTCREQKEFAFRNGKPSGYLAVGFILVVWIILIIILIMMMQDYLDIIMKNLL